MWNPGTIDCGAAPYPEIYALKAPKLWLIVGKEPERNKPFSPFHE